MGDKINYKRLWSGITGGSSSGGGTTPTSTTYAALSATITANTTTEGFYLITDATSGSSLGAKADLGVLVQVFNDSEGINRVREEAEGVFLNPDYENVGDYSVVSGFGSQLGIWHAGLAPIIGDVAIWSGLHYRNQTGAVGVAPSGDAVNWAVLTKSFFPLNVGYIAESDFVLYDFVNDALTYREDKRGNTANQAALPNFQWGYNITLSNKMRGLSKIGCLNSRAGSLSNLITENEVTIDITQLCEGSIDSCIFTGINNLNLDLDSGNYIYNCEFQNNGSTTLASNTDYDNLIKQRGYSNFPVTIAIDGLTTLNITALFNYAGIVNLTSANATETINLFSNFPTNHPVRIQPETGLTVTFTHATGANQPICEGGINAVINGTNGDWVEFTRRETSVGSGVFRIYQTNIGTY